MSCEKTSAHTAESRSSTRHDMKTAILSLLAFSAFLFTGFAGDSPFAGTWETNWGELVIKESGEKLTGNYKGKFSGSIEGEVKDSKFHFTWKQPNAEWGSGVFTVSEDGKKLTGTWGGGESATNGGPWTGTRK